MVNINGGEVFSLKMTQKEKARKASRDYYRANRERIIKQVLDRRNSSPEQKQAYKEYKAAWFKANRARCNAYKMKRKAARLRATPEWVDYSEIRNAYLEAEYQGMQVDHVIPLQGKNVCGLHVWDNFQLLTLEENSKKYNKFNDVM